MENKLKTHFRRINSADLSTYKEVSLLGRSLIVLIDYLIILMPSLLPNKYLSTYELPILILFFLIFEYYFDGTPGKLLCGIKKFKYNGLKIPFYQVILKYPFKILEFFLGFLQLYITFIPLFIIIRLFGGKRDFYSRSYNYITFNNYRTFYVDIFKQKVINIYKTQMDSITN